MLVEFDFNPFNRHLLESDVFQRSKNKYQVLITMSMIRGLLQMLKYRLPQFIVAVTVLACSRSLIGHPGQ